MKIKGLGNVENCLKIVRTWVDIKNENVKITKILNKLQQAANRKPKKEHIHMTNLKTKIAEIQALSAKNSNTNIYYEITKVALDRNELYELLSADDSYAYDANGKLWLSGAAAGFSKWYGMQSPTPILETTIVCQLERIYEETKSSEIESQLVSALKKMLYETPEQFYIAIQCFSYISRDIQEYRKEHSYSRFDYYGRKKELTFDAELRPFITKAIMERSDFLKENFVYDCNLWEKCAYHSKKFVEKGLIGFMPESWIELNKKNERTNLEDWFFYIYVNIFDKSCHEIL